LNFEGVTLYN